MKHLESIFLYRNNDLIDKLTNTSSIGKPLNYEGKLYVIQDQKFWANGENGLTMLVTVCKIRLLLSSLLQLPKIWRYVFTQTSK